MPLDKSVGSIKAGVGGTLGGLALIMGFGAMLGQNACRLCGRRSTYRHYLIAGGKNAIQWAVSVNRLYVGFALFYEVGFVLMLPLVFTIAAAANIRYTMRRRADGRVSSHTASCRRTRVNRNHATIFHADMGKTLLFGAILAIPTVILAGRFTRSEGIPINSRSRKAATLYETFARKKDAGLWRQRLDVAGSGVHSGDACGCRMILPKAALFLPVARVLGDPVMATLVPVLRFACSQLA